MAVMKISGERQTKSMKIYDKLLNHITSPELAPGQRMASMPRLAKIFDTSVFTIHQAISDLEADGYVSTKNGAGTFVTSCHRPLTMADTVTVCMQTHGHLWTDLASQLMATISENGRIGTLLDVESVMKNDQMARRIAHSESNTLIVSAGSHFPYRIFDLPGMRRKTVVSVLSWTSNMLWSGLRRVILDREEGARLIAEHLYSHGHRNVLILGTSTQIYLVANDSPSDPSPGWPFRKNWERMGGLWTAQTSVGEHNKMGLDEKIFLSAFNGNNPPTAVFGLRDYEAWVAQDMLLRNCPDLAGKVPEGLLVNVKPRLIVRA